ncbi:MAG TPA: SMP-30/gluconolactonase/LRE family protein [Bryobacteraceae bacterium]|nr:SMP-30/gluconolactonase/LRE family protein [Bryobacteraceae bacterium]
MKIESRNTEPSSFNRRSFLTAGAFGALAASAAAQSPRDWSGKNPVRYPDPDILVLDKRFNKYKIGNTPIQRLYTGTLWSEGPAWDSVGRYLVWSDIPNDRQLRWIEDDGHVSTIRHPSGYSNGNTFDYEGRQLSCEHGNRRVVRYERNGSVSVIADKWNGKILNAPNDIVVHPDGAIWFTDPGYGALVDYEGHQGELLIKEAVYRVDVKGGQMTMVTDELYKPNGLCFSPDYKKLYICDTGATHYPNAPKIIKVYDVADEKTLRNGRQYISMDLPGKGAGLADGIRADTDGNIWVGAGWVGAGYDGVHIFSPEGQRIGQILLPEICANVCFGGPKRNRLFMAAGQSLYAVYVEAHGAHIC